MWSLVVAAASAFGVVFVAELGDKTQLLALGFGARHGLRTVALGLAVGYAAAGAFAALVGGVLGAALPERPVALAAGVLFVLFGLLALRDDGDGDDDHDAGAPGDVARRRRGLSLVGSIALTIAIAEMGDKTQLATAALAAQANPFATWIGATGGEVTAGLLGAVAGKRLGASIDPDTMRLASAVLFLVVGVVILVTAR